MLSMLANHLWQSTLFTLAVAALVTGLRKDRAHVRYWLWWAASVKFLVPFSWLTSIGGLLGGRIQPPSFMSEMTVTIAAIAAPVDQSLRWPTLSFALVQIWIVGFVAMLCVWIARSLQLRALLRRTQPAPASLKALLAGANAALPVRSSPETMEPAIAGLLRPMLLMPQGIEERLSREQLDAIVAHEICHWRRRDNLTAAIHMLVATLFWFHPFVWWIGARLVSERERACDESVVDSGHDRKRYAEAILRVCELYTAPKLATVSGVSGADLKRRIIDIMRSGTMSRLNDAKRIFLGTAAGCALALPILAGWLGGNGAAHAQESRAYLPIAKEPPVYPAEAVERRLEGYAIVEFTVTASGTTDNVRVVESSDPVFDQVSIDSAEQYLYEPRIVDGRAVELDGVRTKISFLLEPPDDASAN